MSRHNPTASLSLDLDNQWAYMKASSIAGWEEDRGYLDRLVPRILSVLQRHGLRQTFFIVGKDAADPYNKEALAEITRFGHEIANHSYNHDPAIARLDRQQARDELARTDDAIEAATGMRPRGFRGPSFVLSTALLEAMRSLDYAYDASSFPTFLGPMARLYHFSTAKLSADERAARKDVFGTLRDGLRPLHPYRWQLAEGELLEIPVSTFPGVRTPFHLTYLSFLAQRSRAVALAYFKSALTACRIARVEPSLLLHPLDFVGGDELPLLRGFPGMGIATTDKLDFLDDVLAAYANSFDVVPMIEHARRIEKTVAMPRLAPRFAMDSPA
jgi:peptidoglycan-N-acetylglucosamine deacetylase